MKTWILRHMQAWILEPDVGQCPAKDTRCPMKSASQRTQLSGVKLKKNCKLPMS